MQPSNQDTAQIATLIRICQDAGTSGSNKEINLCFRLPSYSIINEKKITFITANALFTKSRSHQIKQSLLYSENKLNKTHGKVIASSLIYIYIML